jgi:hypothetical protein
MVVKLIVFIAIHKMIKLQGIFINFLIKFYGIIQVNVQINS